MDFQKFTLGENDTGRRLDKVVRKFLPLLPLSLIYKNIRSGFIRLNGKKTSAETKTALSDELWIASSILEQNRPEFTTEKETHQTLNIDTVFKNQHIWVINKPYGIPVQKAQKGQLSLDTVIKSKYITESADSSLSFKPGPLHRLDTCTTGLLAFSQSLAGAQWFSDAIAQHKIKKTYTGILEGRLASSMRWEDNIEQDKSSKAKTFRSMTVSQAGKTALTEVIPLAYGTYANKPITLAEFHIQTGRTHQIRVQSAFHGFPLLGDTVYKSSVSLTSKGLQRYFLHARYLEIPKDNPVDLPEKLTAELPVQFNHFLSSCLIETPNE